MYITYIYIYIYTYTYIYIYISIDAARQSATVLHLPKPIERYT